MSEFAFAKRLPCGCVVAVTIQDEETLHYTKTVAEWKRNPKNIIERMTVEQARAEFGQTFENHPRIGKRRNWKTCKRARLEAPDA